MADYGLLGGIAEGLKSGFQSYQSTKAQSEDRALKARLAKLQELSQAADIYDKLGTLPEGLVDEDTASSIRGDSKGSGLLASNDELSSMDVPRSERAMTRREREAAQKLDQYNVSLSSRGQFAERDPLSGQISIRQLPATEDQALEREYKKAQIAKLRQESGGKGAASATIKNLGSEAKKSAGAYVSALSSLDDLESQLKAGNKPSRFTSKDVPLGLGRVFKEDQAIDVVNEKLADDIGRMRSGGAINSDEEARFKRLLPTAADSGEAAQVKITQIRNELKSRLGAYGVDEAEYGQIGYRPGGLIGAPKGRGSVLPMGEPAPTLRGPPKSLDPADKQALLDFVSKAKNENDPKVQAAKQILGLK